MIAFFHGLESKPVSDKTEWLSEVFENPYMPPMNYRDIDLFQRILREVRIRKPDLLIGSSMGGWFAYCISTLTGIPTLLFNPAVQGRSMDPPVELGSIKSNHTVIFGKSDKVISPTKSLSWFKSNGIGDFQFNWESNGHRTPIDIFQKWTNRQIDINESQLSKDRMRDLSFLSKDQREIILRGFDDRVTRDNITHDEIIQVIMAQKCANPEDIKFAQEADQSPSDVFYRWLVIRGEHPSFFEIDKIWTDSQSIELIKRLKEEFKRPRPYWISLDIKPVLGTETETWSYPSGHALGAWNIASYLSIKFPHLTDGLFSLAEKIAQSRVIAGVHFPSDIKAARELAFAKS